MFSGIIKAIGTVRDIQHTDDKNSDTRFVIKTPWDMTAFDIGASICCSGCCLTITQKWDHSFAVDVSNESLSLTTLKDWRIGTLINLEPSLRVGDEMGGHVVTGHVDAVAEIVSISPERGSHRLLIRIPDAYTKYISTKGSVALDGISLTINDVQGSMLGVNIIPHTWAVTTLGQKKVGDKLNFEVDPMARTIVNFLEQRKNV
jgi:riboflavin synthase